MSYYVIDVIMTLRDVVGWLVRGFRKKGAVRLGPFLLGPPGYAYLLSVVRSGVCMRDPRIIAQTSDGPNPYFALNIYTIVVKGE